MVVAGIVLLIVVSNLRREQQQQELQQWSQCQQYDLIAPDGSYVANPNLPGVASVSGSQ